MGRQSIWKRINHALDVLDKWPLWILGIVILIVNFTPILKLGQGCVFPYHDQMDETMLTYVLNGRHFLTGEKLFPEMLGGVNKSGLQPAAVLFVPLYRWLAPLAAFLIQYGVLFLTAFYGMYFCVKELTNSQILSLVAGSFFCLLPWPPVYGMSVVGVPLAFLCFLYLYQRKHLLLSFCLLFLFGLASHLVLIGYVILGFWLFALLWMLWKKNYNRWLPAGFLWLLGIYVAVNHNLFLELLLGRGDYVSHREELVNYAAAFGKTVQDVFLHSAQHADSLHQYLIVPILIMLVAGGICSGRMERETRKRYRTALGGFGVLAGIAIIYGLCRWEPVVQLKNHCTGFLHYFQLDRFYWLYPAGWILEFVVCFSLWWRIPGGRVEEPEEGTRVESLWRGIWKTPALKLIVLFIVLYPTIQEIKVHSYLYMNVNQINNGSGITGYISWESYYAEDLMQQLEDAIGRNMEEYRIAHLGISPAPSLMHGFYTVDGYSNNYSLEYKHRFRKVIARELEKNEQTRLYFDQWGSRCYLFNGATGNAWMLGKNAQVVYEKLEFDMEALGALGCEYIFSCGMIQNAEELGLSLIGYYETESSYWGVWLYEIKS